jgi:hypothetical protein
MDEWCAATWSAAQCRSHDVAWHSNLRPATRRNERCVPTWSGSSTLIPQHCVTSILVQRDFAGPGPYSPMVLPQQFDNLAARHERGRPVAGKWSSLESGSSLLIPTVSWNWSARFDVNLKNDVFFFCHIHILLLNIRLMIYMLYITWWKSVSVRARCPRQWARCETWRRCVVRGCQGRKSPAFTNSDPARRLRITDILGTVGTITSHNNIFVFIFEFYSLIRIQWYIYVT